MDRVRTRRHKHAEAAELDVTPFMNLMIVLVPVLLLSMVFTHTTVIDLNFPTGEAASGDFDPDAVHLEVAVYQDRLEWPTAAAARSRPSQWSMAPTTSSSCRWSCRS